MRHVLAILLAGLAGAPACAETFAPLGLWRGVASGDLLVVQGPAFCSVVGSVTVAGPCTWTPGRPPGDRSGTLAVTAAGTVGPSRLDLVVRWLDADTILVGAERFERRG